MKFIKLKNNQKGVTLVELLVTMGLLAGFLVILSTIITATLDMQLRTGSYSATTSDSRYLLSRLSYDIKRASAVTTPGSLGGSGTSLVLTIDSDTYTYSVDNDRLQLDIDGVSEYITGDQTVISNLSFKRLGAGSSNLVQYGFTITGKGGHSPDEQTYHSTTGLRP